MPLRHPARCLTLLLPDVLEPALGHPASALAHLAAVLADQPQFEPLAAGEIVTTGTLTAAMPIKPGEVWSSEYDGLPITGLELHFTA